MEGPISLDLAMDKEAAPSKGYESPVAGDADILLVPDIVAGNLAAKSMTVLGGCKNGRRRCRRACTGYPRIAGGHGHR